MNWRSRRRAALTLAVLSVTLVSAVVACSSSSESSQSVAASTATTPTLDPQIRDTLLPSDAHNLTNPENPRATLVLFTDFQCPYCAKMDVLMEKAIQEYGSKVRMVVRNYPLPMHRHAKIAAQAVEAAEQQGALERMAHKLFQSQEEWAQPESGQEEKFSAYAQELGLDGAKFTQDMHSDEVKARVEKDEKDATTLGVQGTPTLVLNGRVLQVNSGDYDSLKRPLDTVLAS